MSADVPDAERHDKPSLFKRIILGLGLACLLQFFVFAGIGVARGHSIQSWVPVWIMLAGIFLVMPFGRTHRLVSFLTSASIIVFALASISQGRHQAKGDELLEAGKFPEAMVEYRKEIDTWYLRICHNYREAPCMFGIALCQSQLEQFDEARKTYADITTLFRGYYKERADEELVALDANLLKAADLEKDIAEQQDDREKALLLFDLALVYRELNCSHKAVQQYENVQPLEIDERFKGQALRFAEELQ